MRVPRAIPTAIEDDIDISLTYMRTTSSERREFRDCVMITGAKTIFLLTREQGGANEKKNQRAERGKKERS